MTDRCMYSCRKYCCICLRSHWKPTSCCFLFPAWKEYLNISPKGGRMENLQYLQPIQNLSPKNYGIRNRKHCRTMYNINIYILYNINIYYKKKKRIRHFASVPQGRRNMVLLSAVHPFPGKHSWAHSWLSERIEKKIKTSVQTQFCVVKPEVNINNWGIN